MPTIEHNSITRASLNYAAWAFQCLVLVNSLAVDDPNTGFHMYAADSLARDAWDAYSKVTRAHEPAELESLMGAAADAAENASNLLMAYSTTLARPNTPDVS